MTKASPAPDPGPDTAAYARLYEKEHPRLVAYARSLTGNAWVAEDLVAEAHFRVWRRLRTGHHIDNVSAYLTTTVRHLSWSTAGRSSREIPRDPAGAGAQGPGLPEEQAVGQDPAQRVAYVDLLARVMGQLPERWVKALWLAEAEDQPLESVGRQIGANSAATAVLLHRAREGMRQAFLRAQPGAPSSPTCAVHWERMPAHVRGADSPRQAESIALHVEKCAECRDRLAVLAQANTRLPALVGPALLVLFAGGGAKFLAPLLGVGAMGAAGAGGVGGSATGGAGGQPVAGALKSVRHLLRGQLGQAGPVAATVAGAGVVAVAGIAVAVGLLLSGGGDSAPRQRAQAPAAATSESAGQRPADPAPGTEGAPRDDVKRSAAPTLSASASASASAPGVQAPGSPSTVPPAPTAPRPPTTSAAPPHQAPSTPPREQQPTRLASPTHQTSTAPTSPSPSVSEPTPSPAPPTPTPTPTVPPTDIPTPVPTPTPTPTGAPTPTPTPTSTGTPTQTPPSPSSSPTDRPTNGELVCRQLVLGWQVCWYR
ncbi:sigma factor [Streptomyces zagrosensis]|uniref:RNA polymerase sigma factor (Sigma-70 family) n=1 Tax=Streptomyces zagrosensis TaxID=1042984 RepID=A0A7W9UZZ2_9ACTN|nr:RNA polymerase sigma factor [Streptomyces zagrosensis]MBB5937277.1 RNA polymerase sigma factor (sigma-70 family) [Streptomyces zagrosensis]